MRNRKSVENSVIKSQSMLNPRCPRGKVDLKCATICIIILWIRMLGMLYDFFASELHPFELVIIIVLYS